MQKHNSEIERNNQNSEERIEMNERKAWIFQSVPKTYNLKDALADPELQEDVWRIRQYQGEIRNGDFALLWKGGKHDRGIYAVVEIISDPNPMVESERSSRYWINSSDKLKKEIRVGIRRKLGEDGAPLLLESKIKTVSGLMSNSFLNGKFRQGTNFKVTNDEWQIIKQLLNFEI